MAVKSSRIASCNCGGWRYRLYSRCHSFTRCFPEFVIVKHALCASSATPARHQVRRKCGLASNQGWHMPGI